MIVFKVKVISNIKIKTDTSVTLNQIIKVDLVYTYISRSTLISEDGSMIKEKVSEFIWIKIKKSFTKVIGKMINLMDSEFILLIIMMFIEVISKITSLVVSLYILGLIIFIYRESLKIIKSKVA